MNPTQQIAVAAGFLQALYASEPLRTEWYNIQQSGSWTGLCELIQETLGLAVMPTEADLTAMRAYVASTSYKAASPTSVQDEDPRIQAVYIFNGLNGPTSA